MRLSEEERELYQRALNHWGEVLQMFILFEEMSELQQEVCKVYRCKTFGGITLLDLSRVAEEIADTEIMLGQMATLMGVEAEVEELKAKKLQRLRGRLERDEK